MSQPQAVREVWQGLDCTLLTLPSGDQLRVADYGAQLLSWQCRGRERLFLSELAVLDRSAAIRGGVPVCFPQFNQRGPLPKHGLARRADWQWQQAQIADEAITAVWRWQPAAPLHADFAHGLAAELRVTAAADLVQVELVAENTGASAWAFTGALHTYLAVQGADQAALSGLDGQSLWDAARGFAPQVQAGPLTLGAEVDRVYARPASSLRLRDAAGLLEISQSAEWPETVVWNPGPALCTTLADMQPDDWQRMLCVEAAAINQPIALQPGQRWQAAQRLQVLE